MISDLIIKQFLAKSVFEHEIFSVALKPAGN
jgi:hypothetical protein